MNTLQALIKRNTKLFFKDKGMFFSSLITPAILLSLYALFLSKVYRDSFTSTLPTGISFTDQLLNGLVSSQLISSLLAVSCVTVAFCSNMLMVQDKANSTIKDLTIAPVKASVLAMSYYLAAFISTLIVCYTAVGLCLIYAASTGWYMSVTDVLLLLLDTFLLAMFGTALSSIVHFFLHSQGQISAVGTIISAGYGFICGAYMPISQFSEGIQKVISFLPGTYGTSLMRNHAMRGVYEEMALQGIPTDVIDQMKNAVDCNVYFFDKLVPIETMYLILLSTIGLLIVIYIFMHYVKSKKAG
ncbi:MAG: ABC transporter permease [Clostridiales bacterium]|nr:ABC transporter permease [Clostridiales bacterium]